MELAILLITLAITITIFLSITSVLCKILLKIIYILRSALPWRVNCWFCNSNTWVKYPEHNSWTCPKCEQYNGFTKDGDYNKTIILTDDQISKTPKVFEKSPPNNGLCKMCNINQQLKVTQLANFVPRSDKNFNEEIEAYSVRLEKAYCLCSPCRRVLQLKLLKDKENFSSKSLEHQSPKKEKKQTKALKDLINNTSILIATSLFILVTYEFYCKMMENKNLPQSINNAIEIIKVLLNILGYNIKMNIFTIFPTMEIYYKGINIDLLPKKINDSMNTFDHVNMTAQEVLGVIACVLQILANICNENELRYTIAIDFLWTVFTLTVIKKIVALNPVLVTIIKITNIVMLLLLYKFTKHSTRPTLKKPMALWKLANSTVSALIEEDDHPGVNNLPLSNIRNSALFNYLKDIWTKPKVNSTFCVNTMLCKTPNSTAETVFAKPSIKKYQKLAKDDYESDLDESISSLSLGGPTKSKKKTNSIFSLRKFTSTPNFVTPTATSRGRPLISPSRLGHSTSWVAGGYWDNESARQNFNADGSRSSSQSSGFECQTSGMAIRNMFWYPPPPRAESVCGERTAALLDRFKSSYHTHSHMPQNLCRMSSPVFPQMQYNSLVYTPQTRFPHHPAHSMFVHHSVQNGMFKTPASGLVSGIIKLPQRSSVY